MNTTAAPPRPTRARIEVGPGLGLSITLEGGPEIVLPLDRTTALALAHELAGRCATIDRGAAQARRELAEIMTGGDHD